ncbi:glycerophosphoryl diester phosphodiesterase membrane domain-containing protein [Sphingomonas sp. CCH13-B11]|jgi:hypothetical protein|nr:glycerophosphoryl diester phosphodiesterase membrane domain-containing protein [Sphingomonas sp. CCH13-B11]
MSRMVNMDAVWDRSMEFVSDNLGAVLAIVIPFIFIPQAIGAVMEKPATDAEAVAAIVFAVIGVIAALAGVVGQTMLTALVLDPDAGATAARARGLRRFLPIIGVSLVLAAAMLLLFVPIVLILAAYGFNMVAASTGAAQPELPPVAAAWSALYVIVLMPVFFFLAARLILVMPALVDAPIGLGAIRRSWSLTRGMTLKIIGVIILFAIVAIFLTLGVSAGLGALLKIVAGGDGVLTVADVLIALVAALVATGLAVVQTVFVARLYVAAVARHASVPVDPLAEPAG